MALFKGAGFWGAGPAIFFTILGCFGAGLACPARCTYRILADAILSPRDGGLAGVAVGVDYWWDALWGGW